MRIRDVDHGGGAGDDIDVTARRAPLPDLIPRREEAQIYKS